MTTYAPTAAMEGLMMRTPLLVRTIAERAGLLFAGREIVSATATGVERTSYGEAVERVHRLASAPHRMGIRQADGLRRFLGDRVADWWLPDRVEFIAEVPKTSVGKFDKKVLRAQLAEGTLGRA